MTVASPEILALTRRLIALEAASDSPAAPNGDGPVRVIEELGVRLVRLSGRDGFRSVLARALNLAKAEFPSLGTVTVGPTGTLEGFERIEDPNAGVAGQILVAHFLSLLVTFIGESLTFRLVLDRWPDAPFDRVESGVRE